MRFHRLFKLLTLLENSTKVFSLKKLIMENNGIAKDALHHCGTNCNLIRCWKWDVSRIIKRHLHSQEKYAVLILNRPIIQNQQFITSLWNNAMIRHTVDGGTTRWVNFVEELPENVQTTLKMPDIITGDFDSIQQNILKRFKKVKSCKVIHTPDQNHTDFTKALMELNKWCRLENFKIEHVVTICQSSGRMDQILGNIQTMFLNKERCLLSPHVRLYLMTDSALSWLLQPGEHTIIVPEESRHHKRAWCSLIPIGETCTSISTTGLKWNLNNQSLQYGGIVSTSNTFDGSEVVTVKCTNTVLWSMKIPSLLDNYGRSPANANPKCNNDTTSISLHYSRRDHQLNVSSEARWKTDFAIYSDAHSSSDRTVTNITFVSLRLSYDRSA